MAFCASTPMQSAALPLVRPEVVDQNLLLIVWNESHRTGISILDEQHRGLVAVINSLYASLSMPHKDFLLRPAVDMFVAYTRVHFATEIELMKMAEYPALREHHAQHEQIIVKVSRNARACLEEGDAPERFVELLKEWFLVHIAHEDKAYSAHLLEYFRTRTAAPRAPRTPLFGSVRPARADGRGRAAAF